MFYLVNRIDDFSTKVIWIPEQWIENVHVSQLKIRSTDSDEVYEDMMHKAQYFYTKFKPNYTEALYGN